MAPGRFSTICLRHVPVTLAATKDEQEAAEHIDNLNIG